MASGAKHRAEAHYAAAPRTKPTRPKRRQLRHQDKVGAKFAHHAAVRANQFTGVPFCRCGPLRSPAAAPLCRQVRDDFSGRTVSVLVSDLHSEWPEQTARGNSVVHH